MVDEHYVSKTRALLAKVKFSDRREHLAYPSKEQLHRISETDFMINSPAAQIKPQ